MRLALWCGHIIRAEWHVPTFWCYSTKIIPPWRAGFSYYMCVYLSFEFEAGVEAVVAREEGGEGREALDVGD